MILHEFPDLAWLKSQITQGFTNRQGWKGLALNTTGLPSVIIHANVRECYRPDIKGPLSLFLNLRGTSYCQVEGETRRIGEGYYCISNCSQLYTLQIERGEPVE